MAAFDYDDMIKGTWTPETVDGGETECGPYPDYRGLTDIVMVTDFCPTQMVGRAADGTVFYVRCRRGCVSVYLHDWSRRVLDVQVDTSWRGVFTWDEVRDMVVDAIEAAA